MKVSELSGAQLDYWVAKAEGLNRPRIDTYTGHPPSVGNPLGCLVGAAYGEYFMPSADWTNGGPIIEREIAHVTRHGPTRWSALANGSAPGHGETPLIAAMRAYVASKFGDTVPDEPQPVA